jgi:hypothetical protein
MLLAFEIEIFAGILCPMYLLSYVFTYYFVSALFCQIVHMNFHHLSANVLTITHKKLLRNQN